LRIIIQKGDINVKRSSKQTYVCVPSSKINIITKALERDGHLDSITMFRGRDARMKALPISERVKTYGQIIKSCPSIELESDALSSDYMKRNFIGMLCIILVSNYDEKELTKYCIDVINAHS
jgi:hypothetical protein